jgi:VCBS repeat protein
MRPRRRRTGLRAVGLAAVGVVALQGCDGTHPEQESGSSDTSEVTGGLHAYAGVQFWTGANSTIPVCWMKAGTQPFSSASQQWLSEKASIIDAVSKSWDRVANLLKFTWKTGTCPETGTQQYVRVSILGKTAGGDTDGFGWSGGTTRGGGSTLLRSPNVFSWTNPIANDSVNFVFRWDGNGSTPVSRIRALGVHEFGHVLGFAHEQDSVNNNGECNIGVVTDPNLQVLTPYDPESVMNYCAGDRSILTPKDVLGVRKAYGYKNPGEFNGDPYRDVLWRNQTTGDVTYWGLQNTSFSFFSGLVATVATDWRIAGTGDFNHDGETDIVWQHMPTGTASLWLMNRMAPIFFPPAFAGAVGSAWQIRAVADVNADGHPDIVWQNAQARIGSVWIMQDGIMTSAPPAFTTTLDADWKIVGAGDFNADKKDDLVLQSRTQGLAKVWLMNGGSTVIGTPAPFATGIPFEWEIRAVGDYNNDNIPDVVWSNRNTGEHKIWILGGPSVATGFPAAFGTGVGSDWVIVGP